MAAKKLQEHTATGLMDQPGWGTLQHYYTIPYYVAVKFALWDDILATPRPGKELVYPKAILHYARGMAYMGKNDKVNARKESEVLKALAADTTLQDLTIWGINTTADLVHIADKVLSAEIAAGENRFDAAVSLLREAVKTEDNLNYNEPPDWFFSVRHHLGAVLLKASRYEEAEKTYRQDLQTWKNNGWALHGLYQSLVKQKKDARAVKTAFDQAWKYADVTASPAPAAAAPQTDGL